MKYTENAMVILVANFKFSGTLGHEMRLMLRRALPRVHNSSSVSDVRCQDLLRKELQCMVETEMKSQYQSLASFLRVGRKAMLVYQINQILFKP